MTIKTSSTIFFSDEADIDTSVYPMSKIENCLPTSNTSPCYLKSNETLKSQNSHDNRFYDLLQNFKSEPSAVALWSDETILKDHIYDGHNPKLEDIYSKLCDPALKNQALTKSLILRRNLKPEHFSGHEA